MTLRLTCDECGEEVFAKTWTYGDDPRYVKLQHEWPRDHAVVLRND